MAKIVKKIRFDFEASNLETISKQINSMKPVLGKKELEFANQIETKIQTIMNIMDKNPDGFSPQAIKTIREEVVQIINGMMKLTQGFKLDPELVSQQDDLLKKAGKAAQERLETEKEIAELKKKVGSRDGEIAGTSSQLKKHMPSNAISPISGKELTQFGSWERGIERVQDAFATLGVSAGDLLKDVDLMAEKQEEFAKIAEDSGIKISLEEAAKEVEKYATTLELAKEEAEKNQKTIEGLKDNIESLNEIEFDSLTKVGELSEKMKEVTDTSHGQKIAQLRQEVVELKITMEEKLASAAKQSAEELKKLGKSTEGADKETKKFDNTITKTAKNIIAYGSIYSILKRAYRETISTVKALDKALTDMAVVTTMSRTEAWKLIGVFQDLAKKTGLTTTEVANLSITYFRQGRALKDVIELTEVSAKAAKIAGINAVESANYLTAAINGFGLAAREAEAMSDKFAALASNSASSYEELAVGLSKFASQANLAGLSVDFALGLLAKGVETTREAPESIGTALKTVLARMRELTDLGKTMEDGMDVNRVDTALRQIGVSLRNASGEFRSMENVLTDVGTKWDTLTSNQRANVAVSLAGTRQQSRLVAMFQDFNRTLDLVNISLESEGATLAQHANYMEGMEAGMTALTTAWQNFINSLVESETIIFVIKTITGAISGLASIIDKTGKFGKVLIITIASLIVVSKVLNWVLATTLALKEAEFVAETKLQILKKSGLIIGALQLLAGFAIAAQKKVESAALDGASLSWAVYWAAVLGPVGVVIAAITGVALAIAGVISLVSSFRKRNKKRDLEKENNELKKQRYELGQIEKKTKELASEGEKLKNKLFRTAEDDAAEEEYIERLKEQLESLKEQGHIQEDIAYTVDGRFDMEKNLETLQNAQNKILEEQKENSKKLVENAKERYETLLKTKNLGNEEIIKWGQENKEAVALANRSEDLFDNMSAEDQKIYFGLETSFLKNMSVDDIEKGINGQLGDVFERIAKDVAGVKNLKEDLLEITDFSEQLDLYIKEVENLSKEQKEVIAQEFQALELFASSYKKTGKNILEGVEFSQEAAESVADELGIDKTKELFDQVAESMASGKSRIEAWSEAIEEAAEGNEKLKNVLWELASRDIKKLAVAYDGLSGRVDSLNKKQKEFYDGTMSMNDSLEFLEKYSEILEDESLYDTFKDGGDLSLFFANKLLEERKGLEDELQDLYDRQSKGEDGLAPEIRRLELLLMYRGEFAKLTQAQIEYNSLKNKERYLNTFDLMTEEKRAELQKAREKGTRDYLKDIEKKKQEQIKGLDEIDSVVYDIVDGALVINEELFNSLDPGQQGQIEMFAKNYEQLISEQMDYLEDMIDHEIKMIEEANKKKQESYEKYFEALDRLEERRDRQLSREEIAQQLMRLEGASDERSRQRAKELRQELNEFDKQAKKDLQAQMRQDTLEALTNDLEDAKTAARESALAMFESLEEGGDYIEKGIVGGARFLGKTIAANMGADYIEPEGYAKGGLVDYTGLAMLHGSKNRPEAVLSPSQTVAFNKLANNLDKQNFSSPVAVTLGNINISTGSLNNKQDFKSAGRALAEEFSAAINRRGIGVNTKR